MQKKETLQKQVRKVCRSLCNHRGLVFYKYGQPTTTQFLDQLKGDNVSSNRNLQCQPLCNVAKQLNEMTEQIESLTLP